MIVNNFFATIDEFALYKSVYPHRYHGVIMQPLLLTRCLIIRYKPKAVFYDIWNPFLMDSQVAAQTTKDASAFLKEQIKKKRKKKPREANASALLIDVQIHVLIIIELA